MPVLRKYIQRAAWYVEVSQEGEEIRYDLTAEGERFLGSVLSLKDGDEFRPKDLSFLLDRGWATRIVPEPEPEPIPEPEPSPLPAPTPARRPEPVRGGLRRTRGREIALQALYQMEQNPGVDPRQIDRFIDRRVKEEGMRAFARALILGVKEHQQKLDELISAVAENWRIDRMAAIDRNILRIGAFEMLHSPEIPTKVAINEALELAKRYSTAQSSRFVNGILDRLQSSDSAPPEAASPEPLPEPEA